MAPGTTVLGLFLLVVLASSDTPPTNYEYYASSDIWTGLSADQSYFTLNGKNITLYSGSIHYFRVPRAYWRDRLRKIRAAGLNTVETYIAWNLHEPESGVYDFGDGGSEMEDFLHIEEFLKTAQEEDLFVIIRSGPYICAEYNFGGFPSWLLREKQMGLRTNEATYMKYVKRYFDVLMPILAQYQFTNGGPIIAFQVENEYGATERDNFVPDREYLENIRQILLYNGIVELLVSSDNPRSNGDRGSLPGVLLQTANFGGSPETFLDILQDLQPNKPIMAMEFWMGWFDSWSDQHNTKSASNMKNLYERILKYPASVNIYMFHGGTNFGYSNGGSLNIDPPDNTGNKPVTTSYDYDAPLSEAGDYTDKYYDVKGLLERYNPIQTYIPDLPELIPRVAYPAITIDKQITLKDLIETDVTFTTVSKTVVAMETLDINSHSGQSNGYIVYRKENVDLEANTVLKIEGHICDTAVVLVDGVLVSPILETSSDLNNFGYWRLEDSTLELNSESKKGATVDIVVEDWGRMNGGSIWQYNQTFKGLWQGPVYFNEEVVSDWTIIPLEFKKDWLNNLKSWTEKASNDGPSLFHAGLEITDEPRDTYIDMRDWTKGTVFVNGFALGKHAKIGPQQALYLPAPFLKKGVNDIVILEHFKAPDKLSFVADQIWETI